MSKSNTFENDILKLIFNNVNIAGLGDATGVRGSSAAGSLYVSLCTGDPGEAGTQVTNEAAYTGYARVAVSRANDGSGWTVSGNSVSNTAAIAFPKCTGGSETYTHFSIGYAASGATTVCYKGNLKDSGGTNTSLAVSANIIPQIDAGGATITED